MQIVETVTVAGEDLTVSLIVWRRFRRPMPGLVEAIYAGNRELAEVGPILPVGTTFDMPIPASPVPATLDAVRLW